VRVIVRKAVLPASVGIHYIQLRVTVPLVDEEDLASIWSPSRMEISEERAAPRARIGLDPSREKGRAAGLSTPPPSLGVG
jgi:hypothetical protein